MTDIATIIGLISGISGVMIALFTARSSVSKTELESLRATIMGLQAENERLRKRLNEIECAAIEKDSTIKAQAEEIETLRDQVDELRAQIDEMSKRRRKA